ncbi:Bax inhibitor-1/YccA family membrane protein [Pseudomonas aeruginosa]|uniref:Bax inhibitor-1/YccA family membrane protein n=1 Tax=Pseudomonas aeruginosa TaxID=287 RepID=UPI00333CD1A6
MQSNNPILTRVETVSDYSQPMTVQGAIQKSVMLTIIAAAVGVALFFYAAFTANVGIAYAASIVGAIGGLVLALITTFKPTTAPTLAIPYALFEGGFLRWYFFYFPVEISGRSSSSFIGNFRHDFGDVWSI